MFKKFSRAYDNCVESRKNELKRFLSFFLFFFLIAFSFFFFMFQFQNVKGSFYLKILLKTQMISNEQYLFAFSSVISRTLSPFSWVLDSCQKRFKLSCRCHCVLANIYIYQADSIKFAFSFGNWAFGHTEQCNDLPEWPLNNSFVVPNSQCPKQVLMNQLYTIIDVKATDVDDCILSASSNKDIASCLWRVFRSIKANQKRGNILKWMNNKVFFLFIF